MSVTRAGVAVVLSAAMLAAGCGGAAWTPAAAVADPGLVSGQLAPRLIDVLPLDVEVWAERPDKEDVDAVRAVTEAGLFGEITTNLYQRGMQVGAVIDWNGNYMGPGGDIAALAPPDLLATINSLARYGESVPAAPAALPMPYLPARLGRVTGADATLYVGGWGYAAEHHMPTGEKIALGIGIALIAVVIVVAVVAAAKSGGGSSLGSLGSAAAHGAGHVAISASRAALRAGNVLVQVAQTTAEVDSDTGGLVGEMITSSGDAMGHAHEPTAAAGDHPEWASDKALPHHGDSQMFVEMTLVDNHSGVVLWHAHQRFPADPRQSRDVRRAAAALLQTFPAPRA